jgi:hypothetical protein
MNISCIKPGELKLCSYSWDNQYGKIQDVSVKFEELKFENHKFNSYIGCLNSFSGALVVYWFVKGRMWLVALSNGCWWDILVIWEVVPGQVLSKESQQQIPLNQTADGCWALVEGVRWWALLQDLWRAVNLKLVFIRWNSYWSVAGHCYSTLIWILNIK